MKIIPGSVTCSVRIGVVAKRKYIRGDTVNRLLAYSKSLPNGCRVWTGRIAPSGYAVVWHEGKQDYAHRVSYEVNVGPIPEGLDIDHRCHNPALCRGGKTCPHRACVEPSHLQPATRGANLLRGYSVNRAKTKCPHGHRYDEDNTRIYRGMRYCKACILLRSRERFV